MVSFPFLEAPRMSVTRILAGQIAAAQATGRQIHFLGVGYPNPEVSDPRRYMDQARRYLEHLCESRRLTPQEMLSKLYGYMDSKGPRTTRINFAKVFGADFGVTIDPDSVVPTIGGTGGVDFICSLLEKGGQKLAYIVDAPTYTGFLTRAGRYPHARFYSAPIDTDGPDPDELRAQIRKARADGYFVAAYYSVPDGHNPGGISFSQRRRVEIYRVCSEEDILIVEDNAYSYISFTEEAKRPQLFLAMDKDGRVIHLFTASKIGFPGPRVGFAVAPGQVRIAGEQESRLADLLVTILAGQILLHNSHSLFEFDANLHDEAMNLRPSLWPVAREKTRVYAENREIFLEGMRHFLGEFPDLFRWTVAGAGFFSVFTYLSPQLPVSPELAVKLMAEYGITTVPLTEFFSEDARERNPNAGRNQLRLGFSYTQRTGDGRRADIRAAVAAFGRAIRKEAGLPPLIEEPY